MGLRESLASNPMPTAVAAVLIIAACAYMVIPERTQGRRVQPFWYYDVGSGQLFAQDGETLPPVTAPSGRDGVRAHVYACGNCSEANRKIVFVEKYTDKVKAAVADERVDPMVVEAGHLVSKPGNELNWVPISSPQGIAITSGVTTITDGCAEQVQMCRPD